MTIIVDEKPPLDLSVNLTAADGSGGWRWTADKADPTKRPLGLNFKTARYQGFQDGGCTLRRNPGRQWGDLNLLDTVQFVGAGGFIAYEGRLTGRPGGTDGGRSVTVAANGWMDHAKDRKFSMVFIDRDLASWQSMPATRQAALNAGGFGVGNFDTANDPTAAALAGISMLVDGEWASTSRPIVEAWYDAGEGGAIARIFGGWTRNAVASSANWVWATFVAQDASAAPTTESSGDLQNEPNAEGAVDFNPASRYRFAALELQFGAAVANAAPNTQYGVTWRDIAVVGDHGLTIFGSGTDAGVYASDVIRWLVARYCPMLNADGVQDSGVPIVQLAFRDRTFPYDAFLTCNQPHLWSLGVWENRTLHFAEPDLSDWDWQIKLSDAGVTASWTGQSIDNQISGVEVQYTDTDTGQQTTLLPADYDGLRDDSISNPWNRAGYPGEKTITLSAPCTQAYALEVGSAALREFNRPRSPGNITVEGHIRDRAGNWQPAWKVRADDRLLIRDDADAMPLVVYGTEWQHDQRQLSMSVDSTFRTLDEALAQKGASAA